MTRKKQVNSENGAVLNRDFPRRGRSLIIGAEELRRLFPNVKPEYIDLAIKRFSDYRFGDVENEIEVFGKILISDEDKTLKQRYSVSLGDASLKESFPYDDLLPDAIKLFEGE